MTMLLLLKKNISFTKTPTFFHLHFPFSSSPVQILAPKSNLITEYLITSCGFSSEKAVKLSRTIPNLTSTAKPDSVLHFLKQHGFTDANIRRIISCCPRILCTDVNKTLEPNLHKISEIGFSGSELQQLITSDPHAIVLSSALPRLEFWLSLLNNNKRDVISTFTGNQGLVKQGIDKVIIPKIALLKEHGLSETDIGMIAKMGNRLFTRSDDSILSLLKRARELGFSPGSKMFVHGVSFLSSIPNVKFQAKMELFRSFGWSEGEFLAAFQRAPTLVSYSEENIREKMEFLVGKAGCTQSYIASRPVILSFGLEKRLKPRHRLFEILKSNELVERERDLFTIMCFPEKKFVEKFILPYEDKAPGLLETYNAAVARKIPL